MMIQIMVIITTHMYILTRYSYYSYAVFFNKKTYHIIILYVPLGLLLQKAFQKFFREISLGTDHKFAKVQQVLI